MNISIEKWIKGNQSKHLIIWELNWIDRNIHQYEGEYHAYCVMKNIIDRYERAELRKEYSEWKNTRKTKHEFRMIELLDNMFGL